MSEPMNRTVVERVIRTPACAYLHLQDVTDFLGACTRHGFPPEAKVDLVVTTNGPNQYFSLTATTIQEQT